MLGLLKQWYSNRRALQDIQASQLTVVKRLAEGRHLYDDGETVIYDSRKAKHGEYSIQPTLREARNESRRLVKYNAHARNIVNQIINHIVGKGFGIKFDDESQQEAWRLHALKIQWSKRSREIFRRIPRDGEALLRKFGDDVRWIQPEHLGPPDRGEQEAPEGIVLDPEDVESVLGYFVKNEFLEADEVFHFKSPDVDMDEPRGWPLIYDIKTVIETYEDWIFDRALLNRFRTSILLLRKHADATATELKNIQSSIRDGTYSTKGGKEASYKMARPGRIVDTSKNVEWEFLSPNIEAGDVEADGRALRLLIVAAVGLPEYMITGDAANANYASTAVSENPGVKMIESLQNYYAGEMTRFLAWLMGYEEFKVNFVFPSVVIRDQLKETQSCQIMFQNGIVSKETWQERAGLDPRIENARIDEEVESGRVNEEY